MSNRVVYYNGVFLPETQARVSIFDSGFLYGETAFDMTRTFNGVPFHLRDHLIRLQESLKFLQIDSGLTLDELELVTLQTFARNSVTEPPDVDWHIRHDISRGPAELYHPAMRPEESGPTVIISCWPLIRHMGRFAPNYDQGVKVVVSPQRSIPPDLIDPRAKTRSRVHFQLAQLHAKKTPGAWPVLTDENGCLTEGPSWNILVLRDGTLWSPRSERILHGISRTITFEAAVAAGLRVDERDITPDFVRGADEVLCTATSFGLVPVVEFEGKIVGSGQPGHCYHRLFEHWKSFVGIDFIAQARDYASRLAAWEEKERAFYRP